MAKPIKETPVLTGKDAFRFEMEANNVVPASPKKKERVQKAFAEFCKIAKFSIS